METRLSKIAESKCSPLSNIKICQREKIQIMLEAMLQGLCKLARPSGYRFVTKPFKDKLTLHLLKYLFVTTVCRHTDANWNISG